MKYSIVFAILAMLQVPNGALADGDEQARLDAACEAARERELAPLREQYIEECVQTKLKRSREACEQFYSDFGAQSGNRAPLFYDLPECVKAFEFRENSSRR